MFRRAFVVASRGIRQMYARARGDAPAALLASGGRLRGDVALGLLDGAQNGIFAIDGETRIVYANERLAETIGFPVETLLGRPTADFLAPGSEERLRDNQERRRMGIREHAEFGFTRSDGTDLWAVVSVTPVFDRRKRYLGAFGVFHDVSTKKQAEDARRASEERLRAVVETAVDAIVVIDAQGTIASYNPAAERIFGYVPEDVVGRNVSMLMPSPDREQHDSYLRRHLETGEKRVIGIGRETTGQRKDGSTFPMELSVGRMTIAGETAFTGIIRDISERKEAEAEREAFFTYSVDLICGVDTEGRFLKVNPSWSRLLGYPEDVLVGRRVEDFVHTEDRQALQEGIMLAGRRKVVQDLRLRFHTRDGEERWLSWNAAAPVVGKIHCVVRDVTEQVNTEQQNDELMAALEMNSRLLEEQLAEIDQLREEAQWSADHDALTGLMNRRSWFREAVEERGSGVAAFDIDHFKQINDTHGHAAGDAVLREVARRLSLWLPQGTLGRLGGEEFAAFFAGTFTEAVAACEAAIEAVRAEPVVLDSGASVRVTISAGLCPWRSNGHSREYSLGLTHENADGALYEAKRSGRDRLVVVDQVADAA